jgi:kumamolisin
VKKRSRALAIAIGPLPILAGVILAAGAHAAPDPTQALAQNMSPALAHSTRQGAVASDATMSVAVGLKLRHTDELDAFLAAVSDPASPRYGHYLTPQQFLGAYGPSQQDVDAVRDYLRSSGLTVTRVEANRQVVDATGTAAQMSKAFRTSFGEYTDPTLNRDFYANDQAPTLPANIASVVQTVSGLDNHNVMRRHSLRAPGSTASAPQADPRGFGPSQLRGVYDTAPLNAKKVDGTGETVAVWEFDGYQQPNIAAFDKQFSLTSAPPVTKSVDGANYDQKPGQGQGEVELDIEVIRGMAPGANQIVYEAPNSDAGSLDMANAIVSDNKASVTSISWGSCEANTSASSMTSMDNAFKQGAAQGISFYSATGDSGSDDCGKGAAAVDYPASDPFVTGVGGTSMTASGNSYGSETGWSGSGGGVSTQFAAPSWQPGSNGKRTLPDVSSDADPKTGYAIFTAGNWAVFGGTSCAAPMWAGFTALYNQSAAGAKKSNLGYANPALYKLAGGPNYGSAFHDVTSGSNGGFQAGTGYDQVTGWGSYDGDKLITALLGG